MRVSSTLASRLFGFALRELLFFRVSPSTQEEAGRYFEGFGLVTMRLGVLVALLCAVAPVCVAANGGQVIQVSSSLEWEAYALYNQGVEREGIDTTDAFQFYLQALELKPDLLQAHNNLGCICNKLRNETCAEMHFTNLLQLSEEKGDRTMLAAAYNNLALLRFEQNKHDLLYITTVVIPMYEQALSFNPTLYDAMYNQAAALQAIGDEQSAFPLYQKVLSMNTRHVGARTNLGNLYLKLNRYTEAIEQYSIAVQVSSGVENENALNNLGQAYKEFGDGESALEAFREAEALHGQAFSPATLNILVTKRMLCDWEQWDVLHERVYEEMNQCSHSEGFLPPPYETMLMPRLDKSVSNCSRANLARVSVKQYDAVSPQQLTDHAEAQDGTGFIRLGYLSYDMNNHPMGHLTYGLLANHNHSAFRIGVYSYGNDDGSLQREKIVNASDAFIDIAGASDVQSAARIQSDGVQVLFDLMAHTRGARIGIVAAQPSSIVVNYLGYPGTSGFSPSRVQYLLADQHVLPVEALRVEVTESMFYLPNSYQANSYEVTQHYCPTARGKAYFETCQSKLREIHFYDSMKDVVVFANLNTITKLEPEAFSLWMRIMRRVPRSVLWLLQSKGKSSGVVEKNVRSFAAREGVDPGRIRFAARVPKKEHIDRLPAIDLFLDTLTYGAHSTASDVLWSGVPMITMRGTAFASRVGMSILSTIGMQELITFSLGEYEDLAVRLAESPSLRFALRSKLGQNIIQAPFFFSKVITAYVEAAARTMVETKQSMTLQPELTWVVKDDGMEKTIIDLVRQRFFEDAAVLHREDQFDVARHIYHRLLDGARFAPDLWHLLGVGEKDPALVRRAIELNPHAILYRYNLGHILRENGQSDQALKAYLETLDLAMQVKDEMVCQVFGSCVWMAAQEPTRVRLVINSIENQWATLYQTCSSSARQDFSNALDDLGSALLRTEDFAEASRYLEASVDVSAEKNEAYVKRLYSLGSTYTKLGKHEAALKLHSEAVQVEHNLRFQPVKRPAMLVEKPVIVIYCYEYGQSWWPKWGPDSPSRGGVGGSEEAVIFLAREMTEWYNVIVYADPREEFYGRIVDGVLWMPVSSFDTNEQFDVFVAWRYHISLSLARNCSIRFLWLQDMVSDLVPQIQLQHTRDELNGVFVLSKFHKRMFDIPFQQHVYITPNALDDRFFVDGNNDEKEMIYASSPNRGLEQVLELWPYILQAEPELKLRVYYGFTKSFLSWGEANIKSFNAWLARMKQLLKQPGVYYYGLVQHEVLAEAYAKAGFALYPTSFPETGCVSLMKAQAMGAIPITSRYEHSTLPELCGLWDLGPPAQRGRLSENKAWQRSWADAVIAAVRTPRKELHVHRRNMKIWARRELLWSSVAVKWRSAFEASSFTETKE